MAVSGASDHPAPLSDPTTWELHTIPGCPGCEAAEGLLRSAGISPKIVQHERGARGGFPRALLRLVREPEAEGPRASTVRLSGINEIRAVLGAPNRAYRRGGGRERG